jgi:hypothetical protein
MRSGRLLLVAGALGYFALSCDVRLRDILSLVALPRRRLAKAWRRPDKASASVLGLAVALRAGVVVNGEEPTSPRFRLRIPRASAACGVSVDAVKLARGSLRGNFGRKSICLPVITRCPS